MNKDLLLVIDMQNVYLPGNKWACDNMPRAIKCIEKMITKFPKENVIFTKFISDPNAKEQWEEYNKVNSEVNRDEYLNELVPEIAKYVDSTNCYEKSVYSSAKICEIRKRIEEADTIYVTGVVAECCVLSTIFDLIDMGKKVVYVKDGIAGQNDEKERCVMEVLRGASPVHVIFK